LTSKTKSPAKGKGDGKLGAARQMNGNALLEVDENVADPPAMLTDPYGGTWMPPLQAVLETFCQEPGVKLVVPGIPVEHQRNPLVTKVVFHFDESIVEPLKVSEK